MTPPCCPACTKAVRRARIAAITSALAVAALFLANLARILLEHS